MENDEQDMNIEDENPLVDHQGKEIVEKSIYNTRLKRRARSNSESSPTDLNTNQAGRKMRVEDQTNTGLGMPVNPKKLRLIPQKGSNNHTLVEVGPQPCHNQ